MLGWGGFQLKQSMFRWKVDFQKEMELRYKGVMEEMEQRLTQDLEDAKQEKLELQEKYMIDSVNWKEQVCLHVCLCVVVGCWLILFFFV